MDDQGRRDRIAMWAYDTRAILGRFHLWLEDVEERWSDGGMDDPEYHAFVGPALEHAFIVATGVTALGTRLYGGYGEGEDADKARLNRVKKEADAVSAYAISEALWYLTRALPENHALLVSLGEGLMPKAGETPEMGSNPEVGFGRVYARPEVARTLDRRVQRLINNPDYRWADFWRQMTADGIHVWGAALDTLENTSRFALGAPSGPMTVLHVFDQPLQISAPYEGYVGLLSLPRAVVERAQERSVLISYDTPRAQVLEAITWAYPDIERDCVHVWTLGGPAREHRLGGLWAEWRELGVHLVEDGWQMPGAGLAYVESGSYAPTYSVGTWEHEGRRHLFVCDGYSASAEAIASASLDPILGTRTALRVFSSQFRLPVAQERRVMALDPDDPDFAARLAAIAERDLDGDFVAEYRDSVRSAQAAGVPCSKFDLDVDDFFPEKSWRVMALGGYMLPDPYTGLPGVERVGDDTYRVWVRAATRTRIRDVGLTLRFEEPVEQSRPVFSPLLQRFAAGEDHTMRGVKVSDSGRIRNELQTLCSDALDFLDDGRIRVNLDRVDDAVLPPETRARFEEVLRWYQERHPIWFRWLELP